MSKLTKRQLILSLGKCRVNKGVTADRLGDFGIRDIYGTTYKETTSKGFLETLTKLGADVSNVSYSKPFWLIVEAIEEEVVLEEVSEEPVVTVQEEEPAEVVEEQEASVDWVWVESLDNTKEDKLALDEYAEKFDVKLSRRKSLENMIVDFKEAL